MIINTSLNENYFGSNYFGQLIQWHLTTILKESVVGNILELLFKENAPRVPYFESYRLTMKHKHGERKKK